MILTQVALIAVPVMPLFGGSRVGASLRICGRLSPKISAPTIQGNELQNIDRDHLLTMSLPLPSVRAEQAESGNTSTLKGEPQVMIMHCFLVRIL